MNVPGLAADLARLTEEHTAPTITLREVLLALGDRGFGLFLVILSLPSALPVPAPGYSTPFGLLMLLLGFQMLLGKTTPTLPNSAMTRELKSVHIHRVFRRAAGFFRRTETLLRPRLEFMSGRAGRMLSSVLVMIMACLMILPIPLTNTLPAMVIFLIGLGLIERDGLAILFAVLGGWIAAAVYATIIYLVYYLGSTSFEEIKELTRAFLGL